MQPADYPSPLVSVPIEGESAGRRFSHVVWIPQKELFRVKCVLQQAEYSLARYRGPQRPRVVLDIGANVGLFTLYMKIADPDAVVHCFEPAPSTLELLQRNVGHLPSVQIHPYALGKTTGEATLHLHQLNTGQHSLQRIERDSQYCGEVIVHCRAAAEEIDELALNAIDVLKIDTEGCETDIFESLGPRIERADYVLLEYHSESDRRRLDHNLANFLLYSANARRIGRGTLKYVHRRLVPGQRQEPAKQQP
jgi:FkbM family methyltransferase